MIYSKANLKVASVASSDPLAGGLSGVYLEPDGSTVAGNGRVMMAVEPVPDDSAVYFPERAAEQMEPGSGMLIPVELIKKVVTGMEKGAKGRTATGYVALTKMKDFARVGFTSVNAKGDPTTNAALPLQSRFPDWRTVLRKLWPTRLGSTGRTTEWKVCLMRSDLLSLLKAMEEAAPGGGPVFISGSMEGDGVVLRTTALDSKQRVVGAIGGLEVGGNWLPLTKWERGVFSAPLKRKVVR